jgi:hypothetical protein
VWIVTHAEGEERFLQIAILDADMLLKSGIPSCKMSLEEVEKLQYGVN